MFTPGRVPTPVVVLFGPNRIIAPELLVDIAPDTKPFGSRDRQGAGRKIYTFSKTL